MSIAKEGHNIDKNIIMAYMDFLDKSHDSEKIRKDLAQICHHPTLKLIESGGKPHAPLFMESKKKGDEMKWYFFEFFRWFRCWIQKGFEYEQKT